MTLSDLYRLIERVHAESHDDTLVIEDTTKVEFNITNVIRETNPHGGQATVYITLERK